MYKRYIKKPPLNKSRPKPLGLININNNCYMNSVIQCLFHLKKFRDYFLENKNFSLLEQPMSYELSDIFKKLNLVNGGKSFGLNLLKKMMEELDDSFLDSNNADSVDLLSYLFSTLSIEQTNFIGPDISMMSALDTSDKEKVFKDCQSRVGEDTALIYVMNYIEIEYNCGKKKKNTIRQYHNSFYSFENKCYLEFNLDELNERYIMNKFFCNKVEETQKFELLNLPYL